MKLTPEYIAEVKASEAYKTLDSKEKLIFEFVLSKGLNGAEEFTLEYDEFVEWLKAGGSC